MWRWAVLLCLTVVPVHADPNDLTGGVFILHRPPEIDWSCISELGACAAYSACGMGIQECDEQNPRMDDPQVVIWYVIAAWLEAKTWSGVEFGLGAYPEDQLTLVYYGSCFPNLQGLEIPGPGWPAPNTGISLATTTQPWEGNFLPVYCFLGYGYPSGQFPLTSHPETGFGGFANSLTPSTPFAAACFGSLGIYEPGVACCPEPLPLRVCCVGEQCFLVESEYECTVLAGTWYPQSTSCSPNPCSSAEGACCMLEDCYLTSEVECVAMGGTWHSGYHSCGQHPLPCVRACCFDDLCRLLSEESCLSGGGVWHPEDDACLLQTCQPFHDVCCVGEACYFVLQEECGDLGGAWHPEYEDCSPNPCLLPHDVCCVGEVCHFITQDECFDLGGTWHPEYVDCSPNPCAPQPDVCCLAGQCFLVLEGECHELGGYWEPQYADCIPNPCDQVCCIGETCQLMSPSECEAAGGIPRPWYPGCNPDPCAHPPGGIVCCIDIFCYILPAEECFALGGYESDYESCDDPDACFHGVPGAPHTWGSIKNLYR